MRKKFLVLSVAVLFVFGAFIAGCGGSTGGSTTPVNDNEIRIGANFELTGGVADYGKQCLEGIQLAFKEINDAGGINGKKLTLIIADNKSEPAESTNAITKLIKQDKVSVVLGPAITSATLAAVQVAHDNKVPVITPSATSENVTIDNGQVRPFIFRTCFIDPMQGTIMAAFAQKTLSAKTAVLYVDNSSDYSKGLAKSFQELFEKNGGQILGQEAYLQKDQDFKSTLTKIKGLNPEVIFLPGYYEEVSKILKQARELGITAPFLGGDGWDNPKLVEIAGPEALNNSYFSNHYSSQDTDPNVVKFVEAVKKEYNKEPSGFIALGYDTAGLLIDALKRANSTDPQKIRDALEQTKDLTLTTSKFTIDEKHNPIKSAVIIELKDGKQVFKEKINP